MKTKTLALAKGLIPIVIFSLFLMSCGKKEEPQTQNTQQNQQQMQQVPQQQTQQQVQQQKQADSLQLAEKQKAEELKKKEEEKKQAEDKKNLEEKKISDIDFAPIFQQKCIKCHGKDGKGKAEGTPDFTSASFKKKSNDRLFKSISNGIKADNPDNESMPAWKGKLTDDQIRAAIKYVKGL